MNKQPNFSVWFGCWFVCPGYRRSRFLVLRINASFATHSTEKPLSFNNNCRKVSRFSFFMMETTIKRSPSPLKVIVVCCNWLDHRKQPELRLFNSSEDLTEFYRTDRTFEKIILFRVVSFLIFRFSFFGTILWRWHCPILDPLTVPANFSWQQIADTQWETVTPTPAAVIHTASPFLSDLISHRSLVRSIIGSYCTKISRQAD